MAPGLRCTVCTHPERAAIDRALVQPEPRESDRAIASKYGLVRASIQRHRANHIKRAVERASRAANLAEAKAGATTLARVEGLFDRALDLLGAAEGDRDGDGKLRTVPGKVGNRIAMPVDVKAAATAIREARGLLGLRAELLGEVKRGTQVSILLDNKGAPRPEWAAVQRILGEALAELPEGPRALASAAIRRRFAAERAKVGAWDDEAQGGPVLLEDGGT